MDVMKAVAEGLGHASSGFSAAMMAAVLKATKMMHETEERMIRLWCAKEGIDIPADLTHNVKLVAELAQKLVVVREIAPPAPEGVDYRVLHRSWCVRAGTPTEQLPGRTYPYFEMRASNIHDASFMEAVLVLEDTK